MTKYLAIANGRQFQTASREILNATDGVDSGSGFAGFVRLATLETLGEPPVLVTVLTRDGRVRENGIALGYSVE